MNIQDKKKSQRYPELQECTQIHELAVFCADDERHPIKHLSAYCKDIYICFNLDYEKWDNLQCFSYVGVPYLCPNNDYRATYFMNGTLKLLAPTGSPTKSNVNISSGVCFKSQNITYFAYSDQQHNNVYVYNFNTQNHFSIIFPYVCSAYVHQDCPQLLILENQYLIICDANHNLVFDATTNFSLVFNISSDISDIFAILHSNVYGIITPSPPVIHSTTTAKVPPAPGMNHT